MVQTVLVVEDDKVTAAVAGKLLDLQGIQSEMVVSLAEAIERLRSERAGIDVIILDLYLGDSTGLATVDAVIAP